MLALASDGMSREATHAFANSLPSAEAAAALALDAGPGLGFQYRSIYAPFHTSELVVDPAVTSDAFYSFMRTEMNQQISALLKSEKSKYKAESVNVRW